RPDAGREADLVAPEILRSDEVGQALGDEAGRQHAVAEDGRVAGHLGELLVVVNRVEVAGRARVAHQVGARQPLDHERRELLPFAPVAEERHPCTAPSVSMTVFREYATTSPRWLRNSVSPTMKSIFPPRFPCLSKTSLVRDRNYGRSPARIGRTYSNSCSP